MLHQKQLLPDSNCLVLQGLSLLFLNRTVGEEAQTVQAYPNHPHMSKRKECGALLLRRTNARSQKLIPIKAYPYQPLRMSLGRLVMKGFVEACEQWRQ